MVCPSCGTRNIAGADECRQCHESLMQEDVPQPDTPLRWRVMVDPVSSLDPSTVRAQTALRGTPLVAGIRQMQEANVGYLLITDEEGRLRGIFTEHDVLCSIAGCVDDLEGRTVDEFMTVSPCTVHPDSPIAHALHFMAMNDFMYVPIVDHQTRPVDLLSFRRVGRLIEQIG